MIHATVAGIPGVHTVLATAQALSPPHAVHQIRLAPGTIYGRWRGGDTLAVEAWRCTDADAPPREESVTC